MTALGSRLNRESVLEDGLPGLWVGVACVWPGMFAKRNSQSLGRYVEVFARGNRETG